MRWYSKQNPKTAKNASTRKKAETRSARKRSAKRSTQRLNPNAVQSLEDLPEDVPLEFTGLIAPDGNGGSSSDGRGKTWTFSADLAAWRLKGGPVVRQRALIVARKISSRKLSSLMKSTPNLGIIEFQARRPANTERPKTYPQRERFELIKLGKKVRDSGLQSIKKELSKPVEHRDAVFGSLKLNRQYGWFEGKSTFRGNEMNVIFSAQTIEDLKQLIQQARPFWRKRQVWFSNFRKAAYEHYTSSMSDAWWEGEGELTQTKFFRLLGWPVTVEFSAEEEEFSYRLGGWCEELYTDHGVDAYGSDLNEMEIQF